VEGVLEMPPDDCVKTLAGEGTSYKEARTRAARLDEATTEENISIIRSARNVHETLWPVLKDHDRDDKTEEKATELASLLESEMFFESLEALKQADKSLSKSYSDLYGETHARRAELYAKALETVKGLPEWAAICKDPSVSDAERNAVISPLSDRAANNLDLPESSAVCNMCKATIAQMETDITVVDAIRDQVIRGVQELAAPGEKIERVRISTLFTGRLESPEDVEIAINQLKEHLLKLVASGMKVILE
jgi:hypothetical protein